MSESGSRGVIPIGSSDANKCRDTILDLRNTASQLYRLRVFSIKYDGVEKDFTFDEVGNQVEPEALDF